MSNNFKKLPNSLNFIAFYCISLNFSPSKFQFKYLFYCIKLNFHSHFPSQAPSVTNMTISWQVVKYDCRLSQDSCSSVAPIYLFILFLKTASKFYFPPDISVWSFCIRIPSKALIFFFNLKGIRIFYRYKKNNYFNFLFFLMSTQQTHDRPPQSRRVLCSRWRGFFAHLSRSMRCA